MCIFPLSSWGSNHTQRSLGWLLALHSAITFGCAWGNIWDVRSVVCKASDLSSMLLFQPLDILFWCPTDLLSGGSTQIIPIRDLHSHQCLDQALPQALFPKPRSGIPTVSAPACSASSKIKKNQRSKKQNQCLFWGNRMPVAESQGDWRERADFSFLCK